MPQCICIYHVMLEKTLVDSTEASGHSQVTVKPSCTVRQINLLHGRGAAHEFRPVLHNLSACRCDDSIGSALGALHTLKVPCSMCGAASCIARQKLVLLRQTASSPLWCGAVLKYLMVSAYSMSSPDPPAPCQLACSPQAWLGMGALCDWSSLFSSRQAASCSPHGQD